MNEMIKEILDREWYVSFSWEFIACVVTIYNSDGKEMSSKAHQDSPVEALKMAFDEVTG